MTGLLEYHDAVRLRIAPTVAGFAVFLLAAFLVPSSFGQINGVPASVTSPGFGGRAINGTPPSVTSLGPNGFTPNFNPPPGIQFFTTVPRRDFDFDRGRRHHHHQLGDFFPAFGAVYPIYVPVPYPQETEEYADDDSEYQGGPTIFDRRGRGEESYIPPVRDVAPSHTEPQAAPSAPATPEAPRDPTMLVFKDGHQLEVTNYAIVGQTLFDLTTGHPRKIAVAELDLAATQKKNDERGVSFQLPPTAVTN